MSSPRMLSWLRDKAFNREWYALRRVVNRVGRKGWEQRTWCYCPGCAKDLCGNNSFVSDDKDGVRYCCVNCGMRSLWDFDAGPAPILVSFYEVDV